MFMKIKRKCYKLTTFLCLLFFLSGCTNTQQSQEILSQETTIAPASDEKILYTASQYAHPSLDTHKEYHGWYTSIYGISESLFKVGDDSSIQPLLAERGEVNGLVWTIVLKGNVCFSNGDPVTADMVIRNLKRTADENPRFAYLSEFTYEALNDKTFTITTAELYPTMLSSLTACETGILHLDETIDFDNSIIGTGPFVLDDFVPEGTVKVVRNEQYWNGEVALDGAVFYRMADDDTLLMAMQNGEINTYTNVNAAAAEIFQADSDVYDVVTVPSPRLQFYILNQNTLSADVRKAINLTIDADKIVPYLGGTVSATAGPFSEGTAYGKVSKPSVDLAAAVSLLANDGYVKNGDGFFEKDGKMLEVNIAYYPARSLDILATLMQGQLRELGVQATLSSYEKPDATYLATGDFDIALYSMNADMSGDPAFFINSTLKDGSFCNAGGFKNAECEKLITQLSNEMDPVKRAELAVQIVQMAIDDNAFGYVALFNKITVLRPGVTGYAENSPFDFYGIDAATDIK